MSIKEGAYDEAVNILEKCATPHGFHAASPGYEGVWARDSVITSIGASLLKQRFKNAFKQSLIVLGNHQTHQGEVPNAVLYKGNEPIQTDYKSIDSTLWFIVGHYLYKSRYHDATLLRASKTKIEKALTWLTYQHVGENPMLDQLPTTDWQDAFPHRYGRTINSQALYYWVLTLTGHEKKAALLKQLTNEEEDGGLWNGSFYLPWRWKNHNRYHERGEWFDSLGNLLAIVSGIADSHRAELILAYIEKENVNRPFPLKAISPPIRRGTKDWQDYFNDCAARTPYHYLNGGVWTFIGGFYILALVKQGHLKKAEEELTRIAEANMQKPYFSEWLNGKTGKPGVAGSGSRNGNQAWNAGMYLAAYEAVKQKKIVI